MQSIHTDKAPAAIGPYSQAKVYKGTVFTSGQIPINPANGLIESNDIRKQTEQVCKNIKAVLEAAGSCMENVIKAVCFLSDMENFAAFNEVYAEYFVTAPARSCVAVKEIPKNALVEIEVIASL